MEQIINSYLRHLEDGNYRALLELFSEKALVSSPLYGERLATDFYRALMEDTRASQLTLLAIFTNEEKGIAAANFIYKWTLAGGALVSFDCVDIFEFDERRKIKRLKIVYDTAATRPAFERQKII